MVPSRLAALPEIDVPGDKYHEVPPRPRIRWTGTGVIENVDLSMLPRIDNERYDTSKFEIVPGASGVMAHDGECMGMSTELALWRFGWSATSPYAKVFNCHYTGDGFLWVLATRRAGKVKETWSGFALHMPPHFRAVSDAPVIITSEGGAMVQPEFHSPATHTVISNRSKTRLAGRR